MKKVGLATLIIGTLSVVTCFSVGFADWTVPISRVSVDNGSISTDSHTSSQVNYNEYINVTSINSFGYRQGYGFNNSITGEYSTTLTVSINATFNREQAISDGAIKSIINENKMSFKIDVSISNTPSYIAYFNISDLPIVSNNFIDLTAVTSVVKTTTSIYKKWNIGYVSTISVIPFSISFNMVYSGNINNIPDFSTNKITISMLPGEYA